MSRTKNYTLIFISALLSSLPFTFPSLSFLTLVSPSVFFYVLSSENDLKKSFRYSYFFSFVYYLGVHYYFLSLYPLDFAGLSNAASLAVVFVGWWGISLFHALFIAIALLLYKKLTPCENAFSPILLASLFTLAELFESLGFLGFPWGHLYLTQSEFLAFIQSASLFGPYFITFIIVLINAFLARFYKSKNKLALSLAFFVFSFNFLFGSISLSRNFSTTSIKVAVVQPSIVSGEKWSGKSSLDVLLDLSLEAVPSSLVVWPETAVPTNLLDKPDRLEKIYSFMNENNSSLITGCFFEEGEDVYNCALYLNSDSAQTYFKQHLVPFGEYVPLRPMIEAFLPFLTDINMLSSDLSAGNSSDVFITPHGKLGALVCFDSIFTDLARKSTSHGAQALVIITNDSWYKKSRALYHHNAQAVFRAVENHRSVIRCANTGISSFIDPCGRVIYSSEVLTPLTKNCDVELNSEKTLYTLTGNVFPYICILFAIYSVRKKKQT